MPATLCMIHEAIGADNAIAKVARDGVLVALRAGYRVSVVAKLLDESLRGQVEWLRLYVPRRLFALQWLTARRFIRRALGGRRFDVVHAHQPQVADLADVFQCHFLTRAALERGCLERRAGARARAVRLQQGLVLRAEDRCYRRWNPATRLLFNSDLTRRDFARLYGSPPLAEALVLPPPPFRAVDDAERAASRRALGVPAEALAMGYLGGSDYRKGYDRVVEAARHAAGVLLLAGGPGTQHAPPAGLEGRFRGLGPVADTDRFYAACDAVVMASRYEPLGLVAFEAAARGVGVIVTPEVGAGEHLSRHGAGVIWRPPEPLGPLLRGVVDNRASLVAGSRRLCDELGMEAYAARLRAAWDDVASRRQRRSSDDA